MGDMAKHCLKSGLGGREISLEEAIDITAQNQSEGLVLQPNNAQKIEFICACCGCCCGILNMHKSLPKPLDYWATNYYAVVDPDECIGCKTCIDTCQVDAVSFDNDQDISTVDLDRCIGCGNCISSCKANAMSLVNKEKELVPPKNNEELYEIIMANKKGKLGKAKIAAKLMFIKR
jgi:ferredoxin